MITNKKDNSNMNKTTNEKSYKIKNYKIAKEFEITHNIYTPILPI